MKIGAKWPFSTSTVVGNGQGLIPTWHLNSAQIKPIIQQARATQDIFGFGSWYYQHPLSFNDQFACDCSSGFFSTQEWANVQSIIDYVISLGFETILFLFAAEGVQWPDNWPKDANGNVVWSEATYQQNWNYQLACMKAINAYVQGKPITVIYDLQNEGIPNAGTAPVRMQYLTRLWVNMTEAFGVGPLNKVTNMTLSFIPDPAALQNLLAVFSGNWPAYIDFHPYGNMSAVYGSWRNVYDIVTGWVQALKGTPLQDIPFLLSETNYNFSGNARQIELAIRDMIAAGWKGNVIGTMHWPISIGSNNQGANEWDSWPPVDASNYQVILGPL